MRAVQMTRKPLLILAAVVGLLLGLGLRVWFVRHFPQVNGDGLIYGDIAKNWLHGTYGLTQYGSGGTTVRPTLIRLPGYPLFLAACFRLFGIDRYGAVLFLQIAIDLFTALVVGWTAREAAGPRAGPAALLLAALCPFTANYVAAPLSETLSISCIAIGCAALVSFQRQPRWGVALLLAATWSYAALLRPDGALLGVASFLSLTAAMFRVRAQNTRSGRLLFAALLVSVLPFVAWTARNLRTFHVFEPLAPRYATDPGEFTTPGFQHWVKTWAVDFTSTYEVYWNADTETIDVTSLPSRAFDTEEQRAQTATLLDEYNQQLVISPALDESFAALAAERTQTHPLRTYLLLPVLRVLDMWLRPRTEMLNIELRWWQYDRHRSETRFAIGYALLNLAYLVLGAIGVWRLRKEASVLVTMIVLYCAMRSLLLADVEAPETRYTIEAFPMLCILGGAALTVRREETPRRTGSTSG